MQAAKQGMNHSHWALFTKCTFIRVVWSATAPVGGPVNPLPVVPVTPIIPAPFIPVSVSILVSVPVVPAAVSQGLAPRPVTLPVAAIALPTVLPITSPIAVIAGTNIVPIRGRISSALGIPVKLVGSD